MCNHFTSFMQVRLNYCSMMTASRLYVRFCKVKYYRGHLLQPLSNMFNVIKTLNTLG